MPYSNRRTGNARSATVITVAALHIATAFALINGLGIEYVRETITNLPTREYPREIPPEAAPPPEAKKADKKVELVDTATPHVPVVFGPTDFAIDLPPIDPRIPEITIRQPIDPMPPITRKAVAANPKTRPANWVSTNDYPTRDIRQGNEGTTVFRLSIDTNGKARDCDIVRSSGHRNLDDTACRKILQRARFDPARNENGHRVTGNYTGRITWVIPE